MDRVGTRSSKNTIPESQDNDQAAATVGGMNPTRLQKIRGVFEDVADLSRTQRNAALRDLRRSDPALVGEVEKLVSVYGRRGEFMESPVVPIDSSEEIQSGLSGTTVGNYQMLHPIGAGGMGEVWCAQQQYPVRRRVAVKLIKAGMETREVVARFETERQALASMEHPAIAQVYDAGSTTEGRPYFAMEFVAGIPITAYCDQHKLSVRERINLFSLVCEGVQHAHHKAIIHRDLKPSNILVVEIDGNPVPKIIDFGVARAISGALAPEDTLTKVGAVLGTPNYMSPEQANSAGEDIDTSTDVYSLGVILYELLCGSLPFDFRGVPLQEVLRRLRESDIQFPSVRVRLLDHKSEVANARRTDPDKLIRRLRGDLDAIAMSALEKERSRRYSSPSELVADIRRHLRNEPISARPANVGYRVRKFIRRHRAVVALLSLASLLLVSFGIFEALQLRRITRERDRADRIAKFMIAMFKVSDPSENHGNRVTARELLDKASKGMVAELEKDPVLQTQMMEVIGTVYNNLGLYREAEPLLDRTLRIRRKVLGTESPLTTHSMTDLSNNYRYQGHFADSEKLDREAYGIQKRVLGPEHPDTLRSMNNLARNLMKAGRYHEAELLHANILAVRRRVLGPEHPDTLTSLDNLGNTLDEEGRYQEAEALEREALRIKQKVLGESHPETLRALHHLADTLYGEGRYAEAENMHRHEVDECRRVLGPEHRDTLNAMAALANALDDEGKFTEAERLERRVIDVQSRVLGPENPDTLIAMNNLAEVLGDEGRYREAEKLHRQVLAVRTRVLGPQHAHTLYSKSKLAWVLLLSGRLDEAENLSRDAREGQARVLGPDHPDTAETVYNLASIAARRGRTADAFTQLQAAIDHGLKPRAVLRIEADPSFKSVRNDPVFSGLLTRAKCRNGC